MGLLRDLEIPRELGREFNQLTTTWLYGNRKDVRDAVLAHADDLPWIMRFGAFFVHQHGWAEYAILVRLVADRGTELLG